MCYHCVYLADTAFATVDDTLPMCNAMHFHTSCTQNIFFCTFLS